MGKCLICNKYIDDFDLVELFDKEQEICERCFNNLETNVKNNKLDDYKVLSLYNYEGLIKEFLLRVKVFYDFEFSTVFLDRFLNYLNSKYYDYIKVYVPSFLEDDKKRGFNHVKAIFSKLKLKELDVFYKKYEYKQSDQQFKDRHMISDVIDIRNLKINHFKKYLVVDDIMTSGKTMLACINKLKELGAWHVEGLVIAKVSNNVRFLRTKKVKK